MSLKVSQRGAVDPFIVMEVMGAAAAHAATGAEVFHLEVGQPATAAPRGVLDAARRALESDLIGYTDSLGVPELRNALVGHYRDFYNLDVPVERIVITTGSSGGFLLAFLAAFDAGDRVALAAPGYPAYRSILSALDIEPVLLETGAEDRFQPTPERLERLEGPLHGLIVASPSNPAGTVLDRVHMAALVDYCAARDIRLVSDEIYHGISYGMTPESAVGFSSDAVVINSFSKYFSMTGWRLGWMVVPEDMARSVECLLQNFFISAPTLSQLAAIAVFDCQDELRANVANYARNREVLLARLPQAGFDRLAPADGAFYIYADVGRLTNDSQEFCRGMLAEADVAATPGIDFDPVRGHRFVRFSFAGGHDEIIAATDRLIAWRAA